MKNILLIIAIGTVISNFSDKVYLPNKNIKEENINIEELSKKEDHQIQDSKSEEEVIGHVESVQKEIESTNNDNSYKESLQEKYIVLKEFIFNGGTIKGRTFSSLTVSAKEKIMSLYENIDKKIDNKLPNYKENIKEKVVDSFYNDKEIVKDTYDKLKDKITSYSNKRGE